MSLKVWLPLNGSASNQGLLGDFIQSTSPSYTSDGKLGKAMTTGAFIMSAEQTASVLNNDAVSFCFWTYIDADTGTTNNCAMFFGTDSMGTNNNRKFSIYNYPSVNDLHLSWMNDAANTTYIGVVMSGVLPSRVWTHVAVTYQNPTCKVYINGVHKYTYTGVSNSSSFAYQTQLIHNASYRRLNDFRIYDHCLSAKEVGEVAKGLVLCYPFNNGGFGATNLIKGNFSCTSTKDAYSATGDVVCTLSADDILANKGKTLTLSYRVSSLGTYTSSAPGQWASSRFGIHGCINYNNSSGTAVQDYPLADLLERGKSEGLYSCSWTIPSSISSINSSLGFAVQTNPSSGFAKPDSDNNETWYLKDVKLEWGASPTSWTPNSADAIYSSMGLNSTVECDCSGIGNNGTRTGMLTYNTNSPRHSGSLTFSNTSTYIQRTLSTSGYANSYTISYWAIIPDMSDKMVWGFSDGNRLNVYPTNGFFCWNTGDSANNPFINNGTNVACAPYNGAWHHYAVVGNGTTTTLYIDGEAKGAAKTYQSITGSSLYISGWDAGTSYKWSGGSISDFRIYATALSADAVKQLYNTPISVDKSGNLYASEFKEV